MAMDTKSDKPAKASDGIWLSYPEVQARRITPVPLADSKWQNNLQEQVFRELGHDESGGRLAARAAMLHLRMTLFPGPINLRNPDDFPSLEDFNKARAMVAEKGPGILGNLQPLDAKLLGNFENFERMNTDGAWFCIRCLHVAGDSKSIFTDRYRNSLPLFVRALHNVAVRSETKKDELAKEQMRILLRVCMHAFCFINGRVLMQKPEPGSGGYDESNQPFLLGIFPLRDWYCRPDFEAKTLKPLITSDFNMIEFAKNSTLAEFSWAVGAWMYQKYSQASFRVFSPASLSKFFGEDLHEHWQVHLSKMRIRVADTAEQAAHHLNEVLKDALVTNSKRLQMNVQVKAEIKSGSKFGVQDLRRLTHEKIKTALYQTDKTALNQVNWPAWLGVTALLSYPTLSEDPPFDASMAAFAGDTEQPSKFEDAVAHHLYMRCSGSLVSHKVNDDDLQEDAAPFTNSLRFLYTAYYNQFNRLCISPPVTAPAGRLASAEALPGADYANLPTSDTSPLNIQLPAWLFLWAEAIKVVGRPVPERYMRDTAGQPLYEELVGIEGVELPVYILLQLNKMTGYNRLAKAAFDLPAGKPASIALPVECQFFGPPPGYVEIGVLQQARYLESLPDSKKVISNLRGIQFSLCLYGAYLRSRMEISEEIHALAHFQKGFDAAKLAKPEMAVRTLQMLQWGERLWRALARLASCDRIHSRHSMTAAEARDTFFRQQATMCRIFDSTAEVATRHFMSHSDEASIPALCKRPSFWKELAKLAGVERKPGVNGGAFYLAFINSLIEQKSPPGDIAALAVKHARSDSWLFAPTRVMLPVFDDNNTAQAEQKFTAGELSAKISRAALLRFILPTSVYANLRWPALPGSLRYGKDRLTRAQLMKTDDQAMKLHAAVAEIGKAKKPPGVPVALLNKTVPVMDRLRTVFFQSVQQVLGELDAKTEFANQPLSFLHCLAYILPADNGLQQALQPWVDRAMLEKIASAITEALLNNRQGKPPGGGRYLTPESVMRLLMLYDGAFDRQKDLAVQALVDLLQRQLTFTDLEATCNALGDQETVISPLLRLHLEKLREQRLQPLLVPVEQKKPSISQGLSLGPASSSGNGGGPAKMDTTASKPTQPVQEVLVEEEGTLDDPVLSGFLRLSQQQQTMQT